MHPEKVLREVSIDLEYSGHLSHPTGPDGMPMLLWKTRDRVWCWARTEVEGFVYNNSNSNVTDEQVRRGAILYLRFGDLLRQGTKFKTQYEVSKDSSFEDPLRLDAIEAGTAFTKFSELPSLYLNTRFLP